MSEDNSIQKGCVEYVIIEDDFEPQGEPLKPDDDQFRRVELVHNNQKTEEGEALVDDKSDYVRIQLSPKGSLFGNQVDLFVRTPIHSSIVQFEGYEFYPNHKAVTKYYPNGSLQHILKDISEGKEHDEWNDTMKSKCIFGLVSAVTHIHNTFDEENPDFSIRYICPENIIFDDNYQPRLIHYVFGNEELGQKPNAYIPPELHEDPDGPRYDEDIWDIGMVMYEILTGHKPFKGKSEDEIKDLIIDGQLPEFPDPSPETDDIVGIIQNCLAKDPKKRPLPYMLFHHLSNLSDSLFPDTNKDEYDAFCDGLLQETLQSDESISYLKMMMEDDVDKAALFKKAEANNPNALNKVGRMYQKGLYGTEKDESKAFEYYNRAAQLNDGVGLYNASLCLRDGKGCKKDLKKSFEMMKKAAEKSIRDSISTYAFMVRDGVGTEKDEEKAIKILEDGVAKNDKECLNALGNMYFDGSYGLDKDVEKGLSLLNKASQQGSEEATNNLALYYFNQGKQDLEKATDKKNDKTKINKALNLFMKAADRKSKSAYSNLANIYKNGDQVPKDQILATKYFKESAKLGDVDSMILYAYRLQRGIGEKKNIELASTFYRDAALKGDKRGQHNYAKIIYLGEGKVPRDIRTAAKFFKMAADQGVPQSMFYYSKIMLLGEGGVVRNNKEGTKYFQKYKDIVKDESKRIEGWEELENNVPTTSE